MKKQGSRLEAKRVSSAEWVIHDHAYAENDPRRVVACIWEADPGEYEVTWVRRLPLPRWYDSVAAVLEDASAFTPAKAKPVPIPLRPARQSHLAAV
jgi:hypothetical protein